MNKFSYGLFILFLWSLCLFSCQYLVVVLLQFCHTIRSYEVLCLQLSSSFSRFLGYSMSLMSIKILKLFFYFYKKVIEILIGIALNLQMALSSVDIFIILILLIDEQGVSFIYLTLQILSRISSHFQCTDLSPTWLNLSLSILVFLVQL